MPAPPRLPGRRLVPLCLLGLMLLPAARAQTSDEAGKLIATLALERERAYVDEQVLLTLEVGVPATAFALGGDAPPALDGARLVALNRREETRTVDGVAYRFTRSVYALFADEPGTLEIPPLAFRATLPVSAGGAGSVRNPRIAASTEAVRLDVASPPATVATWLPAREVTLSAVDAAPAVASGSAPGTAPGTLPETAARTAPGSTPGDAPGDASDDGIGGTPDGPADGAPREVRAGEPFTRRVRIDARGQHPAAIPPLALVPVGGLRVYPEPARLDSRIAADGLHGTRIETSVIVAERPGRALLPAVTLDWWDIEAGVRRTASLPAEPILVVPGAGEDASGWRRERARYRLALAVAAALGVLLATTSALLWRARRVPVADAPSSRDAPSERDAWSTLRRALRRGDAPAVRAALARWRRSRRDARGEIADVAPDPTLEAALRRLDEHLYADAPTAKPDFAALRRALARARRRARAPRAPRATGVRLYPGDDAP